MKMRNGSLWAQGAIVSASLVFGATVASAGATIYVTTVNQEINDNADCSLQEAIYAANLNSNRAPDPSKAATDPTATITTGCIAGTQTGPDIIELQPGSVFTFADPINDWANFAGPSATPIITSDIIVEGRGARLERTPLGRATRAFVVGPNGHLDLREVHVKGFYIHGGNGGAGGGGGGMGAGGAIYVQGGSLLVQWSTFEGNGVRGGNGGNENNRAGGGGGGGLSGNGGDGNFSGGGGGGSRGNGGHGRSVSVDYWGGGGGGRVTSGSNENPGQPCGASGGDSFSFIGISGDSAACSGGGGGGGSGTSDLSPGDGGSGAYGGGGGGGGSGGPLGSGDGADGGFGAGGGGGPDNQGGHGGFGGGGGMGFETFGSGRGQGGTYAGDGSGSAGGGGAGLGGAIFGYLADVHVRNSTFVGNTAERGLAGIACGLEGCGRAATDGRGAGGAIFTVGGDLLIESSTFSGNATGEFTNTENGPVGIGGGAIVVYDPIGSDEATLKLRNTILAFNGPFECYTRNQVTTSGSEGNIITDPRDNTNKDEDDDDTPCPGVAGSDDPGLGPLALNAPGRTPTMAIGSTSPAIDAAVGTSPLDDQRGIARPQGIAADIGAYEFVLPILPPVTLITLSPATPNGSNDWYKSAVGVSITATDEDDEVAQTRCVLDAASVPLSFDELPDASCSVTTVSADGAHTIYAGSRDTAGNTESPLVFASFNIDATAPSMSPSLNVSSVAVGQTGVVASPNATDATSGVASQSCPAVDTSTPGLHTITCLATDNAGNSNTADLTYVVEYRIIGFFSPVPGSKWKVRQTVPVKVALGDDSGTRISDAEGAALAAACRVTFSATGAQPKASQCMKYDAVNHQFVYSWKLGKSPPGSATIIVTVSYPGTTVTTVLSLPILIAN